MSRDRLLSPGAQETISTTAESYIRSRSIRAASAAFCAFLVASPFSTRLAAQSAAGFTVGLNRPTLSSGDEIDDGINSRTGFQIGGIIEFGINEALSLLANPKYIQKGASAEESDSELGAVEGTFEFDYVEIPVLLKWTHRGSRLEPYVLFGPSVGINTGAKITASFGGFSGSIDVGDAVKTLDLSLMLGIGASVPAGDAMFFFFEAGYAHGLVNILEESTDPDPEESVVQGDLKTRGIGFSAGLRFKLGN